MPNLTRTSALLILTLGFVLAPGCDVKTSDRDLQTINCHDAIELASRRSGGPFGGSSTVIWVDPRSPEEFRAAAIPGAINLPFGEAFEQDARVKLRGADMIIVYGTSVQDVLGTAASTRLIELGYGDVYTLKGGIRQWMKDGNAVEGDDPDSVMTN